MSQLYYLKNGSIGHYCDVYKEETVEKLGDMPMRKLVDYVSEMVEKPSHFGNDAERLGKALRTIRSGGSSVSALNNSLEVVAEIEYCRVFSLNSEVSKPAKELIRRFRKEC